MKSLSSSGFAYGSPGLGYGSERIDGTRKKDTIRAKDNQRINYEIYGYENHDKLYGAEGNDYLNGGKGNDKLYGNEGSDSLVGEAGNDKIYGGDGIDHVFLPGDRSQYSIKYKKKNDFYLVKPLAKFKNELKAGNNKVYQTEYLQFRDESVYIGAEEQPSPTPEPSPTPTPDTPKDTIVGTEKSDVIFGTKNPEQIYGLEGDDTIYGQGGDDLINGGQGDDVLEGFKGNDTLLGGDGYDTALYLGKSKNYEVTKLANGNIQVRDIRSNSLHGTDILQGIEEIFLGGETIIVDEFFDQSPAPDPTPPPTPTPEPSPAPEPTPAPVPTTALYTTEPLWSSQWGGLNSGQRVDYLPGGLPGADAKVFETYSALTSASEYIVDEASGQNTIAIVDTGVRYTHKDLSENITSMGIDVVDDGNEPDPWDTQGHGTHVAGIAAAAQNDYGIFGANPKANIMPVKISNDGGATDFDIALGIYGAMEAGAKVINLSFGGWGYGNQTEYNYYKEIYETFPDTLIIAAAGNDGLFDSGSPLYPGHFPSSYGVNGIENIISVGNSDNSDLRAGSSNYGPAVHLFAPGEAILSAHKDSNFDYTIFGGTSMAAPLVAGAVSAYWARLPHLSAQQVKQRLLDTVDYNSSLYSQTYGRMNMARFFYGDSSQSSSQDLSIESSEQSLTLQEPETSPFSDDVDLSAKTSGALTYMHQLSLDNIDQYSREELNQEWIGTLKGSAEARQTIVDKIKSKIAKNKGIFGGIDDFQVANNSLALIDLESSGAINRKRIARALLKRGWFEGFDLNEKVEVPQPAQAQSLDAKILKDSQFNESDFAYSFVTGKLDDTIGSEQQIESANFISTGSGSDFVYAGGGNDLVLGGKGGDLLHGDQGDDELRGGKGKDTIDGGSGNDIITTGSGSDIVSISEGSDVVLDFNLEKDVIEIVDSRNISFSDIGGELSISDSSDDLERVILLRGVNFDQRNDVTLV